VVVEANLKLIENAGASEKIESNSKALRETHGSSDSRAADLDGEIVNKSRDIAAVANDDHLPAATLPVDSNARRLVNGKHAERRPGIYKNLDLMGESIEMGMIGSRYPLWRV